MVKNKTPFEICRDCEFRHAYCHANCEIYSDILKLKKAQKDALKPAESDVFLMNQCTGQAERERRRKK